MCVVGYLEVCGAGYRLSEQPDTQPVSRPRSTHKNGLQRHQFGDPEMPSANGPWAKTPARMR